MMTRIRTLVRDRNHSRSRRSRVSASCSPRSQERGLGHPAFGGRLLHGLCFDLCDASYDDAPEVGYGGRGEAASSIQSRECEAKLCKGEARGGGDWSVEGHRRLECSGDTQGTTESRGLVRRSADSISAMRRRRCVLISETVWFSPKSPVSSKCRRSARRTSREAAGTGLNICNDADRFGVKVRAYLMFLVTAGQGCEDQDRRATRQPQGRSFQLWRRGFGGVSRGEQAVWNLAVGNSFIFEAIRNRSDNRN